MAFDFSANLQFLIPFYSGCSWLPPRVLEEAIIYYISGAPGSNLLPSALFPPLGEKSGRGGMPKAICVFLNCCIPLV